MADLTGADGFLHSPRYANQNATNLESWRTRCGLVPRSMNDSRLAYTSVPERVTCPTCRTALAIAGDGDARTRRELADFDPSTGHLHTCAVPAWEAANPRTSGGGQECTDDCAGHLYAIAQDAERAVAVVRSLRTALASVLTALDALDG